MYGGRWDTWDRASPPTAQPPVQGCEGEHASLLPLSTDLQELHHLGAPLPCSSKQNETKKKIDRRAAAHVAAAGAPAAGLPVGLPTADKRHDILHSVRWLRAAVPKSPPPAGPGAEPPGPSCPRPGGGETANHRARRFQPPRQLHGARRPVREAWQWPGNAPLRTSSDNQTPVKEALPVGMRAKRADGCSACSVPRSGLQTVGPLGCIRQRDRGCSIL